MNIPNKSVKTKVKKIPQQPKKCHKTQKIPRKSKKISQKIPQWPKNATKVKKKPPESKNTTKVKNYHNNTRKLKIHHKIKKYLLKTPEYIWL